MREDGVHQFGFGGLEAHGDDEALDQFGHLGANQMRAQKLARLGIENRLDQPLVLAERDRLAVGEKGEASDLELISCGLCPGFSETDGSDLRLAISTARDVLF